MAPAIRNQASLTAPAELSARYGCGERTAALSNPFAVDHRLPRVRPPAGRPRFILGHLSNLTVGGGTLTAIECFAELRRRGEPVDLYLAGPIQEEAVDRAIRRAADRFGQALQYCGPLDVAAKRAFYTAIDVFLFPATTFDEAEPLVVLEALAAGVPVIASARACIPRLLQGGGGLVVPSGEDFKAAAVGRILAWHKDRNELRAAVAAARKRFAELHERSQAELPALVTPLATTKARRGNEHAGRKGNVLPSCLDREGLLFIGPVPPPVTGRTVVTAEVLRRLRECVEPLTFINIAPASLNNPVLSRLSRVTRSLKACAAAIAAPRRATCAYVAVDADLGMYLTALAALSARLRRLRILLHHHNYSYVSRKTFRMSLLTLFAGRGAIHINICATMAAEMRSRYPRVQNTLALSNVISVRGLAPGNRRKSGPLVLGHLSNLTFEKGIATVINCLRLLREQKVNVRLVLAGPAGDDRVAQLLSESRNEFNEALEHMGPIYGEQKKAFFDSIDVFLFPSRYRNETQGVVNLEAMAAGVPVIAFGQCCIASDLQRGGGIAVAPDAVFEDVAMPHLLRWAADPAALRCASIAARRRFEELRRDADGELALLLQAVSSVHNCRARSQLRF